MKKESEQPRGQEQPDIPEEWSAMEVTEVIKTIPKIDTLSAPILEGELEAAFGRQATELIIDMERTYYISSVGLRAILKAQKQMNVKNGRLVIRHAGPQIRELFDVTGFSGFLNLED